jgi:hypothetical protein
VAFAEKEKAAGLADRERADALRAKLVRRPDPLLDFCRRYGLSLDAIVLGYR